MSATRSIGCQILRYDRVTSTNDLARDFAERGEPEGLVITAEEQLAGRGRMARAWRAPRGTSLQLSILLRPKLAPREIQSITQGAALAVAKTLREFKSAHGVAPLPNISLKWPNDVLLMEKKCAGILVETGIIGESLTYAILGIGVNVNFSMRIYPELALFATTLADELGCEVDRAALERALLENLNAYYARLGASEAERAKIFREWRAALSTLGRVVRVQTPSGVETGVAEDVDADGALMLRRKGTLIKLFAGDVTVLKDSAR